MLRSNPDLGSFYRRLIQAVKPPKLVLIAVVRKLLLVVALPCEDRDWSPMSPRAVAPDLGAE